MATFKDHNKLVETIEGINGKTTDINTYSFIKELISGDCTHMCLVAEDDSGEVKVDYYNLVSWGSTPVSEENHFIPVDSKAGYKIIDRFLHRETVQFVPVIWYGKDLIIQKKL